MEKETETLIEFHRRNNTQGLSNVIKQLSSFHSKSLLTIGKYFIDEGFEIEFIKESNCKRPDILLSKKNLKFLIEVKTLQENNLMDSLHEKNDNEYLTGYTSITYRPNYYSKTQLERLKLEISKLNSNKLSMTSEVNMDENLPPFAIIEYEHNENKRILTSRYVGSGFGKIKEIIIVKIDEAMEQLNSFKGFPKFILFDLDNSSFDMYNFPELSLFRDILQEVSNNPRYEELIGIMVWSHNQLYPCFQDE